MLVRIRVQFAGIYAMCNRCHNDNEPPPPLSLSLAHTRGTMFEQYLLTVRMILDRFH